MTRAFADTWYYLALLNPNDSGHARAVDWSRRTIQVITTEYVLLELGNSLSPPVWRTRFIDLAHQIRNHPATMLLPTTPDLLGAGMTLFAQRPDKAWSLTDCISFAVMTQFNLQEALTGDSHFQQAGFRAVLLEQ